jgi:hypothetical protein
MILGDEDEDEDSTLWEMMEPYMASQFIAYTQDTTWS